MIIDISKILNNTLSSLDIKEKIDFSLDYLKKTNIKKLSGVDVNLHIYKDDVNNVYFDIKLEGEFILPCVRTLKDVKVPFSTSYTVELEELYEQMEENNKKFENTLDIMPNLWENILVEVPLRVVADNLEDENIYGDGWELITNQDAPKKDDPRLEKLKDLL